MNSAYDYIVVGSGSTGAMAAQTLVEAGVQVAVLDVGEKDEVYAPIMPNLDFNSLRRQDENQHEYLLGKNFEGIPWETTRVGSQLTPPRTFLTRNTERFIPFESETLKPMESLARGGLGGGWGLGCYVFSKAELDAIGLDEACMLPAYEQVAKRIGVSWMKDDGAPYSLRNLQSVQPPTDLENNLAGVYRSYWKKRDRLNQKGIFLGRPGLAVLTEDMPGRKRIQYKDMDFWSDQDKSAYRSWMTIDELEKRSNFTYIRNCLVVKFVEDSEGVDIHVLRTDTREPQVFRARVLVLASGVLGTARIVMRSFAYQVERMPFITNPYCYIPCLQWRMLGQSIQDRKGSFGQLVIFIDEGRSNFDVGMAALFSYRSLLLFKLIKETPLNFADARVIMQYLQSAFTIAGIHHPEKGSPDKFVRIRQDPGSITNDSLTGQYLLSDEELRTNAARERKLKSVLRSLGCQPLRTIYTPQGGSIHYAGTLPFDDTGKPFTLNPSGRLSGTRRVYVGDGSGFRYLPAKGLTMTLMANAHIVAQNALSRV
jgi:hypothetical protein